jgi:gas vesicle protein GvpK
MSTSDSPLRIPADSSRGLGQLVVAVLEILRDLMERQAIRRVESGSLTPDEVERLGQALIALDRQFTELRDTLNTERTVAP